MYNFAVKQHKLELSEIAKPELLPRVEADALAYHDALDIAAHGKWTKWMINVVYHKPIFAAKIIYYQGNDIAVDPVHVFNANFTNGSNDAKDNNYFWPYL